MDEARRRLLAALGTTGVAAVAGCIEGRNRGANPYTPDQRTRTGETETSTTVTPTATLTPTQSPTAPADTTSPAKTTDRPDTPPPTATTDPAGTPPPATTTDPASTCSPATATDAPASSRRVDKLRAENPGGRDVFGTSIAISDDASTAIIGAAQDEDPNGRFEAGSGGGSAHVFEQSDGAWSRAAKLAADDGDAEDNFGWTVAVSGDGSTAIVGASMDEDPNGVRGGSVYAFGQSDGGWTQQAKLVADDGDKQDHFGSSVALSNDGSTLVVGAVDDEDPNGSSGEYDGAGSAHVFEESDGAWNRVAKLATDDGEGVDEFGFSAALANGGSTAIIGAWGDDNANGRGAGSAYVFEESGSGWHQAAKLVADDGGDDDRFGWSIAVSDDGATAVIGASRDEDPNGVGAGSAYVFSRSDGAWRQETKLAPDDVNNGAEFGFSVAVSGGGSTSVIGAVDADTALGEHAGAAYVFEASDGGWGQGATLVADDGDRGDGLGDSVAVTNDGRTAMVGAYWDDEPDWACAESHEAPAGDGAGSVYVFEPPDGGWSQ